MTSFLPDLWAGVARGGRWGFGAAPQGGGAREKTRGPKVLGLEERWGGAGDRQQRGPGRLGKGRTDRRKAPAAPGPGAAPQPRPGTGRRRAQPSRARLLGLLGEEDRPGRRPPATHREAERRDKAVPRSEAPRSEIPGSETPGSEAPRSDDPAPTPRLCLLRWGHRAGRADPTARSPVRGQRRYPASTMSRPRPARWSEPRPQSLSHARHSPNARPRLHRCVVSRHRRPRRWAQGSRERDPPLRAVWVRGSR